MTGDTVPGVTVPGVTVPGDNLRGVATPKNVRTVRRALGLVMAGLLVQLGCAFYWSPVTFLLSALLGMPLVVAGALIAWLARARSVQTVPVDT